jgi:hypothetical protein
MLGAMIPQYKNMANTLPDRCARLSKCEPYPSDKFPVPELIQRILSDSSSTSYYISPSLSGSSHTSWSPTCGRRSSLLSGLSLESCPGLFHGTVARLATSCPLQSRFRRAHEHSVLFNVLAACKLYSFQLSISRSTSSL